MPDVHPQKEGAGCVGHRVPLASARGEHSPAVRAWRARPHQTVTDLSDFSHSSLKQRLLKVVVCI